MSDDPDTPVIDNATLVHELVHAVQDQRYNLSQPRFDPATQDEQLAVGGVVEGDATFVEELYVERCRAEWECVATPAPPENGAAGNETAGNDTAGNDTAEDLNVGILAVLLNQYSDGMAFVNATVNRSESGFAALDRLYADPPESTEQVIHVERDETPTPIEYTDAARNGWTQFDEGENGSDTLGEASIFTMFWYQEYRYNVSVIDSSTFFEPDRGRYDVYNYTSAPSAGWANDRLFPYRTGSGEDAEFGYRWVTAWDTERDAAEFRDAYLRMLRGHGARQVGNGTWVIDEGPYADAFRVELSGTTVEIVNAPERGDLAEIAPETADGQGNESVEPDR